MKPISGILLIFLCVTAKSQSHTEKIVKELAFEKQGTSLTLIVANINGDVKVTGHGGAKVLVEVDKSIRAKTSERLERGKRDVQLGVIDRADTLILFVDGVCQGFGKNRKGDGNWNGKYGWGYQWNNCNGGDCNLPYDYTMDFTISLPEGVNLFVSTINDGAVSVEGVKGEVNAGNVNGGIKLTKLVKRAEASTINGDLEVEFARNPDQECRFYALNGDIRAWFQKELGADVSFKSFNGELFSNVEKVESLPAAIEKISRKEGMKYKLSNSRFRIGRGGAMLDFETLNGDVFVKEKE